MKMKKNKPAILRSAFLNEGGIWAISLDKDALWTMGKMKENDRIIVYGLNGGKEIYSLTYEDYRDISAKHNKEITPIIDDVEKEYLSAVIKPFKDKVKCITKEKCGDKCKDCIQIVLDDNERALLPCFNSGAMYRRMEYGREYTLEELGL